MSLRGVRGVGAIVALCVACACNEKQAAPVVIKSPDDAGAVAARKTSDAELIALGTAARDAALKLAKSCNIVVRNVVSALGFFWASDECVFRDGDIDALARATEALRAPAEAAGGDALAFAVDVRLFHEYVVVTRPNTTGTLKHFQHVARAWNTWRPSDPTPIDPVEPDSYMNAARDKNGALKWETCSNEPCVVTKER